jgi:hypothetical protein
MKKMDKMDKSKRVPSSTKPSALDKLNSALSGKPQPKVIPKAPSLKPRSIKSPPKSYVSADEANKRDGLGKYRKDKPMLREGRSTEKKMYSKGSSVKMANGGSVKSCKKPTKKS